MRLGYASSTQLHALGSVCDELLAGPPCRLDASAQLDELLFWDVDAEGADCGLFPNWTAHGALLSVDRASLGQRSSLLLEGVMNFNPEAVASWHGDSKTIPK